MRVISDFISSSEENTYSGVKPDAGVTSRKSLQDDKESIEPAMNAYNIFLFIVLSFLGSIKRLTAHQKYMYGYADNGCYRYSA